jgi:hypothetical protein
MEKSAYLKSFGGDFYSEYSGISKKLKYTLVSLSSISVTRTNIHDNKTYEEIYLFNTQPITTYPIG